MSDSAGRAKFLKFMFQAETELQSNFATCAPPPLPPPSLPIHATAPIFAQFLFEILTAPLPVNQAGLLACAPCQLICFLGFAVCLTDAGCACDLATQSLRAKGCLHAFASPSLSLFLADLPLQQTDAAWVAGQRHSEVVSAWHQSACDGFVINTCLQCRVSLTCVLWR